MDGLEEMTAMELVADMRREPGAVERLRIFAVHGDSSNFDQEDAKTVARLVSAGYRWRAEAIGFRTTMGRVVAALSAKMTATEIIRAADGVLVDLRNVLRSDGVSAGDQLAEVQRVRDELSEGLHGDAADPLNAAETALDALTRIVGMP